MADHPAKSRLPSKDILGNIAEVCIVTPDLYSTIDGLTKLGIGPFRIFDFNNESVKDQELRGKTAEDLFEVKVAFTEQPSGMVFEIMQPIKGQSLMQDFLDRHKMAGDSTNAGETLAQQGVQHLAFDMHGLPMAERQRIMNEHGFEPAMQGVWMGKKGTCHFCFFDTLENGCGTVFETIEFSDDWEDPDEDGGYRGLYPEAS